MIGTVAAVATYYFRLILYVLVECRGRVKARRGTPQNMLWNIEAYVRWEKPLKVLKKTFTLWKTLLGLLKNL
jgi:hypothetical protein